MTREDFVAGLRQLADIYEKNPFVDVPYMSTMWIFTYNAEDFIRNIGAFRSGAKKFQNDDIEFIPDVLLDLKINCKREQICERKVVGTRHVAEKVIPEQVIPAHDEEIVEWECRPILSAKKATVESQKTLASNLAIE